MISLDWLQVMLSGMQEIIKINLFSMAFFEITRSESNVKCYFYSKFSSRVSHNSHCTKERVK